MPPWHADPQLGQFSNDRRLSETEFQHVLAWVDQGCPSGNLTDAPPPRKFVEDWTIGPPDEIVTMNEEYVVPANGPKTGVPYQYIWAGKPFAEDRWVHAVEVRPGARNVVHHITVTIWPQGSNRVAMIGQRVDDSQIDDRFRDLVDDCQMLAAYVPGDQVLTYPPGLAKKIPRGAQLMLEIHYTPNGKEVADRSVVGLIYDKEPPVHPVIGEMAVNTDFVIPAGASNHRVTATEKFDTDVMLLSLNPHLHLRGKSFEFVAVYPGGKKETLLSVPKWDFDWQTTYILKEPKRLPKQTKLRCVAHYDNSAFNPNNPDSTQAIKWGDQTWEEMLIGYYEYYELPP